jgi:hypothetical protein
MIHNPQRRQGRLSRNRIAKASISLVLRNSFAVMSNYLADAAGYDLKTWSTRACDLDVKLPCWRCGLRLLSE